ncbi:MAG: hypothetical protein AB1745_22925, partial [Pseudomonadota bacterium]
MLYSQACLAGKGELTLADRRRSNLLTMRYLHPRRTKATLILPQKAAASWRSGLSGRREISG